MGKMHVDKGDTYQTFNLDYQAGFGNEGLGGGGGYDWD